MSRDSYYQPAMRSAGAMSLVQGLLALTMLSLMIGSASAAKNIERRNTTTRPWQFPRPTPHSLAVSCLPDINDAEAYKTEYPICSNLAKNHQGNVQRVRCAVVHGRPMNVTLLWERAPERAASALLAAVLRHVLGYQRVHLAPENKHLELFNQTDELVISLAAVLGDESYAALISTDQFVEYDKSSVPSRWRLHAWLTPAARSDSACRSTNWTFYSNMTALARCGFIDDYPVDVYMEAMEVVCVGDKCKAIMQKLQKRAKAAGIPVRAIYVNRTRFERDLLTSKYSILFLDFDIWRGEPSVSIVEPPPYVSENDDGVYQSELDYSTGILFADRRIEKYNNQLSKLVQHFKPTPESLRAILKREANGVSLEEAACELAENYTRYISEEELYNLGFMKPNDTNNLQVPTNTYVAVYLCSDDFDRNSYDKTIAAIGRKIYDENPRGFNIAIVRYFVNCSDPEDMGRRLDELMQGPRASSMLGVVSLSVEGAAAASVAAAAHRVPLLLPAAVPDMSVRGSSTWRVAGRLRHVAQALHNFFDKSDSTHVAVLSQPTTFTRHYFGELRYIALKRELYILSNVILPLDLTEKLAMEALRDLRATKTRVVLVNTDTDAAALILAMAVKLNMSYTDGFIWVLREPVTRPECRTIYFTVSLSNQVMEGIPRERVQILGEGGGVAVVPPHSVAIANALMTVSSGFNNIFHQHPDLPTDLHSEQVIRAFEDSLKKTPVTGFNGVKLHYYKNRAIEEAYVYVDGWGGFLCKPQRLATWRVNATSGSVLDQDGSQPTLSIDFSVTRIPYPDTSDSGERSNADGDSGDADGGSGGADGGSGGADGGSSSVGGNSGGADGGSGGVASSSGGADGGNAGAYGGSGAADGGSGDADGSSGGAEGGKGGAAGGSGGAGGGKQHIIVSEKPVNNSNTTFIVRQWIQSITKFETPSGTSASDILHFFKSNQFNNMH